MLEALVHAGGKGSRMGYHEKSMILVDGRPMIDRVLDALEGCPRISRTMVTVSRNTPETEEHLRSRGVAVLHTSGNDYVGDLQAAMGELEADSVLICPADLPMLTSDAVNALMDAYAVTPAESFQVAVPARSVRKVGIVPSYVFDQRGEELALCAVSVVDRKGIIEGRTLSIGTHVTDDLRFALNVNTLGDLEGLRPWTGASRSSSRSPPQACRR
jgi:adenosylcobinamide-phosphate guanylyltransferase